VLIGAVGDHRLRCVTHRDVDRAAVEHAAETLSSLLHDWSATAVG
jgi:hypothetical protein